MSILNVTVKLVAFSDQTSSSNPRLKNVDWLRDISGTTVANPQSQGFVIPALGTLAVFSGIRSTTLDGTTVFSSSWSALDPSRYRFTYTGGTDPSLRATRALTLSGSSVTFTVNPNATATVTTTGSFAAVQVGDEVFVPSVQTGDTANVLSVLNGGSWLVLSKASSTSITLVRPSGVDFQGITETKTLAANNQFRAYSTTGVQVGDSVNISQGFSTATRRTYTVQAVTDQWFEVISTTALPAETGILPFPGMVFYTSNKSFLYVESDHDIVVRVNGDTGNYQTVSSTDASDPSQPGQYLRRGATWSLSLVNTSTSPANVVVIYAE